VEGRVQPRETASHFKRPPKVVPSKGSGGPTHLVYTNGTNASFVKTCLIVHRSEFHDEEIYGLQHVHNDLDGSAEWIEDAAGPCAAREVCRSTLLRFVPKLRGIRAPGSSDVRFDSVGNAALPAAVGGFVTKG